MTGDTTGCVGSILLYTNQERQGKCMQKIQMNSKLGFYSKVV